MQTITRKLWFSAGHRVYGHEGHCANMHGHNYIVNITAWAPKKDKLGRVIDFSVLKDKIDPWIQDKWDHGFIWFEEDVELKALFTPSKFRNVKIDVEEGSVTDLTMILQAAMSMQLQKNWKASFNPTVENMAQHLLEVSNELLQGTEVTVVSVEMFETENCKTEFTHPALDLARWPAGLPVLNPATGLAM